MLIKYSAYSAERNKAIEKYFYLFLFQRVQQVTLGEGFQ